MKCEMNINIISDDFNSQEFQNTIKLLNDYISKQWKIFHKIRKESDFIFTSYNNRLKEYQNSQDKDKTFNEIFIIQIKNEKDEFIKTIFKNLGKILEPDEDYLLPFIIFLVEEKYENNIKIPMDDESENDEEIDFSRFDQKKIFTFPFKQDDTTKFKFIKRIFIFCYYYNELGVLIDENKTKAFHSYINILLIGRSGAGKSTFINQTLGDYYAKEGGSSLSTSHKFTNYYIPNRPIVFIDSPGFEDEKTKNDVISKIKELDKSLKNEKKEQIHLILYFIDGLAENKFLNIEREVLQNLIENPVPILFIASHCENDPDSKDKNERKNYKNDFNKIKKAIIKILGNDNLNRLINNNNNYNNKDKDSKKEEEKETDIDNNLILANFVKSKKSRFEINPFGIDRIFNNMYYYLKSSLNNLKKILDFTEQTKDSKSIDIKTKEKQIEEMLKESIFFQYMNSFEKIEKKAEERARSIINYQTFYAGLTGLVPIADIASHYFIKKRIKNKIEDIYNFEIEEEQNNKKKLYDDRLVLKLKKEEEKKEENKKEEEKKTEEKKEENKKEENKKKTEEEINSKTQGSLANAGKTFIGIMMGQSGSYLLDTASTGAKSLFGFGMRFAGSLAFMGGQIILGTVYGGYKMHSNGEEILNIYKEKFYERKYENLINLIKSFIEAINFLKMMSQGFKELYSKGNLRKKSDEFIVKKILNDEDDFETDNESVC